MKGEAFAGDGIRARLLAALRHELLGPGSAEEVLAQPPGTRYLVGMLAPRGTAVDPAEDESIDTQRDDDGAEEESARFSASLDPSSIGISCVLGEEVERIEIVASWGEYERLEQEWRRLPISAEVSIPTDPTAKSMQEELAEGVLLEWTSREIGGARVLSIFLLNASAAPEGKRPPDDLWLYQPQLRVRGDGALFLPRARPRDHADPDPDVASADLIYRERREFATGHGISAAWRLAADGSKATEVWTEVVPDSVVPVVEPRGSEGLPALSMDALSQCDSAEVKELITPLLSAYEEWIDEREVEAADLAQVDGVVAKEHLDLCRKALERMRAGLRLLVEDADALAAFRFANAAMAEQRRRTVRVRQARRNQPPDSEVSAEWRPFQIGFVLLCLPGIVDPASEDRSVADLLWFPTGGGKTEAYLGLTAFTFAHRRLQKNSEFDTSSGTAVLMRYTLRLLTVQQFGRALTLLCACERLREENPERWGEERFTIGLWVGKSATPNRYDEAKDALEEHCKEDGRVYGGSPYQVLYCPWCGHDIGPEHYVSADDLCRTLVKCPNPQCDFAPSRSEFGLPVLLVDEEIYRNPPSLLLATVDKFAQMAWNGRIQSLYGRVDRRCPRHGFISAGEGHAATHKETAGFPAVSVVDVEKRLAPPELIIQDELHLISGPLGTLVGLYETAVEGLCGREDEAGVVGPKVIASTATIRRADRQIEALFAREAAVFPPLGLAAEDSFFAREAPEKPGRMYVGVYAPGKSVKTALVRVYSALLSRALYEFENDPCPEADSYMTLVGYFNSIRELGGALRLIEDDVPARLRVLLKRGFGPRRTIYENDELTGQKPSSQIPEILKHLDRTFTDRVTGSYPLDVLLASNMISVGVDIDRLGLMVVSGQPKTTAEYIQATSRVGRVHPGLVIEVYNWSRPRDTSHYERFRHYHETFYRHVEATSVTPFSARARDRALAGVLASYVRQDDPAMAADASAENFDAAGPSVTRIVERIVARAREATKKDEVGVETEQQLKNLVAEWARWADQERALVYSGGPYMKKDDDRLVLLKRMERRSGRGIWPVANSLREVEEEIKVVLRDTEGS